MNKRLLLNLIASILSFTTTTLVSFILTPFLLKTIGIEAYSFYPLATNILNYISFFTLALNSMASRFITIEIVNKNFSKAKSYYTSVFYSNIILSGILMIPMVLSILFINYIFNVPLGIIKSIQIMFSLIFVSFLIQSISSVFNVAVFVKNRLDLRAYIQILQSIIKVTLFYILYKYFKPSIIYVGLVGLVTAVCTSFLYYRTTKRLLPELSISLCSYDLKLLKEILTSGIWNSISQLGNALMINSLVVMSNILIGAKAAGEISIVLVVPIFISGIISMLTSIFLPIMTEKYARGDIEGLIFEVKKSQLLLGLVTNIPIAVFLAIGTHFFSLWVPTMDSVKLQNLSMVIIIYLLFCGVAWPIFNLNTILNKVKVPALIMLINGILNIVMILVLNKFTRLGIYSIVIPMMVLLICYFALFIPIYPCSILKTKKTTFYAPIVRSVAGSIIIYYISLFMSKFWLLNSWFNLILFCFIGGIIGLIVNLVLNLSEVKKIKGTL